MKTVEIKELRGAAATGRPIADETALSVLRCSRDEWPEVMACATALRVRRFGGRLRLCSILNARSGACPGDCAFCAQSARNAAAVEVYGLASEERIVSARDEAARLPIDHFGLVTSGETMSAADLARVARAVAQGGEAKVAWCASLGELDAAQLAELKRAGLQRFHHNLETAESFFPEICTTHTYADRLEMLRRVRRAGLEVCSGGILGLGESLEQRVEFAAALRREGVDSIPLNFLIPVPGTRLADREPMAPLDILRAVAMFRLMNPEAEIKVCAGRTHLRDLQAMIFFAGATGMMIGPLLTVAGRAVEEDLRMLRDLEVEAEAGPGPSGRRCRDASASGGNCG